MPTAKKTGQSTVAFACLPVKQGAMTLVMFSVPATELWEIVDINRREPDKEKGYQRVLSEARVGSICRYVKAGNPIPTSILVSFDKGKLSSNGQRLTVPRKRNAGWVIDGQHRLAGIHESGTNIDLSVVAFIGIPVEKQIEQFVKINKEAKNVGLLQIGGH